MTADDYPLSILRHGDHYVVEAPALGLVRKGADLAQVEGEIRTDIQETLDAYQGAGVAPPTASGSSPASGAEPGSVSTFTVKTAIASAAVLLVLLVVGIALKAAYSEAVRRAQAPFETYQSTLESDTTARIVSNSVARIADTLESVTPERRAEVVENLRRIAKSIEPYIAQIRPILEPDQSGGPSAAAPTE